MTLRFRWTSSTHGLLAPADSIVQEHLPARFADDRLVVRRERNVGREDERILEITGHASSLVSGR